MAWLLLYSLVKRKAFTLDMRETSKSPEQRQKVVDEHGQQAGPGHERSRPVQTGGHRKECGRAESGRMDAHTHRGREMEVVGGEHTEYDKENERSHGISRNSRVIRKASNLQGGKLPGWKELG